MVELRKRKARAEPAPPPPAKKKSNPAKKVVAKAKTAISNTKSNPKKSTSTSKPAPAVTAKATKAPKAVAPDVPAIGETINLDDFDGEVQTQDGAKTTLKQLVEDSTAGVVIFTYPKASTPGCTNQVKLFGVAHPTFSAPPISLSIYGLSLDPPKANTTFKTKQSLPYDLLCDPSSSLITPLGFKKAPRGTIRGVILLEKVEGDTGKAKVAKFEKGGPQRTVDVVNEWIQEQGLQNGNSEVEDKADVAGEVADTAAKLDGSEDGA
ncbi:MAG: hypothetical protein M1834_002001 [Cirrosporium novae-zelandiae]|nr:MAG: hypothetical protein M1834_002001 [Cirrosporium novae-zelandiae]